MKKISILALFLFSTLASAYDGTATGKIDLVEVTGMPYSLRVRLIGEPPLCGNDKKWAYINQDDQNYNAYVSVILATKLAGKEVNVFANRDAQGYCKLIHFDFR